MSIIETLRHMELSLFSGEILTKLYTKTSNYEMQQVKYVLEQEIAAFKLFF